MTTVKARQIPWRLIGWGGAAALLALPFIAMQLNAPGVNWTASDFVIFAIMIVLVGVPLEVVIRASGNWRYRTAAALALLSAFLTVWANLAVGIVGSEDSPGNLGFFAALVAGIMGAFLVRFRARAMGIVMAGTAIALWAAFAIAVSMPTDEPFVPHIREFAGTSVFAGLFLASALLFRRAAANRPHPRSQSD